jgi:hypothetical protein
MHMRRREFILGLAMLAGVGRASAQDRARRVGVLIPVPSDDNVLETILKEKGWIVGRNLQIHYRITGGDTDLSRAYARELLALQPDVIFAVTNTSMAALHAEHSNIPLFVENHSVRRTLAGLAAPLNLGTMSQTHFILSLQWAEHFARTHAQAGGGPMTVKRLRDDWTDQPKAMGLTPEVQNLVV